MSTLPPPVAPPAPTRVPLIRIFWITFFVVWALTALAVLANGLGLIDVIGCAINGAIWGGIVVLVVWLYRKVTRRT